MVPLVHPVEIWTDSLIFTTKVTVLDHNLTRQCGVRARIPHLISRPEIAAAQRRRWRHNLLVLFNDIPQTKSEKEACLLKGGTKNEDFFQEVLEGFVCLSLPSLSHDWGGLPEENNGAVNS